jgi:predicted RND superfamily exporter protein
MAGGLRDRVEQAFEAWGRIVVARPVPILLASLSLVLLSVAGLPRVFVDVTFEAFLNDDDRVRVAYESFREQFGRDERIIVAIERNESAGVEGVFDLDFLERLRALHEAIEERVPYLVEVTSLVNARDTRGEGDTLVVEDFLDPWPSDLEQLAERRARALSNPLFRNNVLSADGRVATVVLELQLFSSIGPEAEALGGFDEIPLAGKERGPPPLLTGSETQELVEQLRDVISEFETADFVIHAAGAPVLLQTLSASMARDMPRFIALAILSIGLLLSLLFRRVIAVVAPLAIVALTVASTLGLMGWSRTPIHVPTQILPTFLLAVGVGDSVHLLSIFFERIRMGDNRANALSHALGHSGLALVLTSLTTAAGLASFVTAAIAPVAVLGVLAPAGVMIALFLTLTLLPAILAIAPLGSPGGHMATDGENAIDRLLAGFGRFATHRPWWVVGVSITLALVAGVGASRLALSHDPIGWLDPENSLVADTLFIDEKLGGSMSFEVLLETEDMGGIRRPQVLAKLDALGESFERQMRDGLSAGQTISLADVVKEINRALNADEPEAYVIPGDPMLIAQELLLFENTGTDDLEDMTDSQYTMARMSVRMPWRDAVRYTTFFDLAQADTGAALSDVGQASLTGVLALLVRAISAVVTSIAESYLLAFAVITPLMVVLLGNWRMGLLAMIPNALPILLTLGVMGVFGFPLDTFSLMVGGIALGLAVDDTIHFMHHYRRYRSRGMDFDSAITATLHTAGRAMLITTIVLSVGFLGFVLSSMNNLSNLGGLVAFAITSALFADVLLAPALLALVERRHAEGSG